MRLDTQPSSDVVIELGSDSEKVTVRPATLTFTPSNWVGTMTLTAADDADKNDEKATITHTVNTGQSSDEYDGVRIRDLDLTVADNDEAGVTLLVKGPLEVSEDGKTATYQIVLDSQPDGNVAGEIQSSDPDKVSVSNDGTWSPTQVIFSGTLLQNGRIWPDWDEPQTITVTALDDGDAAHEVVTLTHTIILANSGGWEVPERTKVGTVTVNVRDDGNATAASRASGSRSANVGYARAGDHAAWAVSAPVSFAYEWGIAESLTLRDLWRRTRRSGRRAGRREGLAGRSARHFPPTVARGVNVRTRLRI